MKELVVQSLTCEYARLLCPPLPLSQLDRSVVQLCPTLCDPMDCSMPGLPVYQQLLEFTQTHAY